tara:strand:+ start:13091 stop:13819 length:729 start_codon:yes stop_codon:yes gene_type:complete
MKSQNYVVIIPARYNSKRLPGKPLIKIKGIPMIVRTFNQCKKATDQSNIIVATDSKLIEKVCNQYNIRVLITSKKCLTGTDRVAEVAKKIKKKYYINVQGDEPICSPLDIKKIINFAKKNPKIIVNGYTRIKDKELYYSSTIPKIVYDQDENLLYASRAPIPSNKKRVFIKSWRQVCIYSFPYNALRKFASCKKKTSLESIEDIEINRFIELGFKVKMLKMSNNSISVDTKKDLNRIKKIIN